MRLLGPSAPGIATQTTFSLQVVIKDNEQKDRVVGTAKEITPSQTRTNTPVGGVGIGDRILELVPGRTSYTLKLSKFSLWKKPVQAVLGYSPDERMLAQWQVPFDIKTYHVDPNKTDSFILTVYRGCQINNISRTQQYDDDVTLVDEVEIDCARIDGNIVTLPEIGEIF